MFSLFLILSKVALRFGPVKRLCPTAASHKTTPKEKVASLIVNAAVDFLGGM